MSAIIYFDWQRADLSPAAMGTLEDAMKRATTDCIVERVTIIGHEDMASPPDFARAISERRAQSVADGLAALGMDRSVIRTEGKGNSELQKPTAPGVREPLNRRATVEFRRWPGQGTEAFDSQGFRMALTEALPRLLAGRQLSDPALDHPALIAGLREVAGPEYIDMMAADRADFATIAGWMHAEGLGYAADPAEATRYFRASCEGREPAGCIGFARMVGQGLSGLSLAEAQEVLSQACTNGVSEACPPRR